MRIPYIQFFPMDWRENLELRACSWEARGVWMDLICVMHQGTPYGHLSTNGKPMCAEEIRLNLPGLSPQKLRKVLAELEKNGVFSRTAEGVIYSRRMVRDGELRDRRHIGGTKGAAHGYKGAEYGKKGGRPRKQEPALPQEPRGVLKTPPSSSSSISPPAPSLALVPAPTVAPPPQRQPEPATPGTPANRMGKKLERLRAATIGSGAGGGVY